MNAYELANDIKQGNMQNLGNAANMLRQQADRIAELEKLVSEMKYEKSSGVFEKQSEPVAWISIDVEQGKTIGFEKKQWAEIHIPLYTTPQTKPLSDEETIEIFNQIWVAGGNTNGVMHRFARAIEERHGIK